jgi:hypothetical protein
MALVRCATRRLVVIAPGLSEIVAKALAEMWRALGPKSVQVVLDSDPEVCRLGLGDVTALEILRSTAEELGTSIQQQRGLRVGVIITDETTTIFSPTPLLVEAGGRPGERQNAIRLEASNTSSNGNEPESSRAQMNLEATPISQADVQRTIDDLKANPPVKFDLAQKVRVFNAQIEFVDFEVRGAALSRKTVPIPSDLMGFAKDPKVQKLLRSSFQLVEKDAELSGESVTKLRKAIAQRYLKVLPNYGTVVLRRDKARLERAVKGLRWYIRGFARRQKENLQAAIDKNREVVVSTLLPSVIKSPPKRWRWSLGNTSNEGAIRGLLDAELARAFGSADDVFQDMKVSLIFKGVTYECLSDPEFIEVASKNIPYLKFLHDEFDAAKAQAEKNEKKAH